MTEENKEYWKEYTKELLKENELLTYKEWLSEWVRHNCDYDREHNFEYVYKLGESGRIILAKQCQTCGIKPSGSAIKHSDVPNLKEKIALNEIKKYSEELEKNGPTYERYCNEYVNLRRDNDAKNKLDAWRKQHAEYLQTNQWKTIRQKVLKRDNYLCQGCLEKPATEVHHKTYENWQNELMFELISVCYDCHHNKIHKKNDL
jgi:5-methylcytosine-specific restriction endonuclease McrA